VTEHSYSGLVLAAGASARMPGRSKLGRAWSDTTVLGAVLRCAAAANLEPLFVACPDGRSSIEPSGRFTVVRVPASDPGRATSLAAGLSAMPEGPVIVLLGDEPGIRRSDILTLAAEWAGSTADMARIRYGDRPGHPVLLGPTARQRARELSGDVAIWNTLQAQGLESLEVAVQEPAPIDVDSPSDLRRARRRRAGNGGRA